MNSKLPKAKVACLVGAAVCGVASIVVYSMPLAPGQYWHTNAWLILLLCLAGMALVSMYLLYDRRESIFRTGRKMGLKLTRHAAIALPLIHLLVYLWMILIDPITRNQDVMIGTMALYYMDFPLFIIQPLATLMVVASPLWLLFGTLQWFVIGLGVRWGFTPLRAKHMAQIDKQRKEQLKMAGHRDEAAASNRSSADV